MQHITRSILPLDPQHEQIILATNVMQTLKFATRQQLNKLNGGMCTHARSKQLLSQLQHYGHWYTFCTNSMNPFQAKLDVPPNSLPKRQCQSSRLHPSHDA